MHIIFRIERLKVSSYFLGCFHYTSLYEHQIENCVIEIKIDTLMYTQVINNKS